MEGRGGPGPGGLITAQAESPPPPVPVSVPAQPHLGLEAQRQDGYPSGYLPVPPVNATLADAVRQLGADAAGYTLNVGSPAQEREFGQYRQVREDAQRSGMPRIEWSCPHGVAKANFPHRDKQSGAAGLISSRNIWPREHGEPPHFTPQLKDILARYPSG